MSPGVDFEAKMMVEGIKGVREAIQMTAEKMEAVCLHFPEYSCLLTIPGFGPDVSSKVFARDSPNTY